MSDQPNEPTRSGPSGPSRPSGDPTGEGLSYEAAREELVEVVRALETGGTDLEESLALWERGEKLAQICQAWLEGARQRLDAAVAERDDAEGSD